MKSLHSLLRTTLFAVAALMLILASGEAVAQKKKKTDEKNDTITSGQVSGLKWRRWLSRQS